MVAAIRLPGAGDLEGVVIDQGHPSRAFVAVRAAQVGHEDPAWPAMHGVGARVARLGGKLLGLDRAGHGWLARVWLGVEDVGSGGAHSRPPRVGRYQGVLIVTLS